MVIISIIVPVYNVAEYLPKCIDSIRKQIEQNWELILVDDGSKDGSGEICDNYTYDSRIRVIHKCNEGVSSARNVGLKLAKGKYICFIDSDDWVEPDYLSSMLKYAGDEYTVVYANLILDYDGFSSNRIAFNYEEGHCVNETDYADFMLNSRILENGYPWAKLFSKTIIDKYSLDFDVSISYHEDHLFVLNYLLHTKRIILSGTANYHYMHRGNSVSLSKMKHPTENMITASCKLIAIIHVIIDRYHFCDILYIKHLYTILGLNQLVGAALDASREKIYIVGDIIREKKDLFRTYYMPNHSYVRIIPVLFFLNLDLLVLLLNKLVKVKYAISWLRVLYR